MSDIDRIGQILQMVTEIRKDMAQFGATQTRTLKIFWEGSEYDVSSDEKGYLDFVGFLTQLGDGRRDLIDTLLTNFSEECQRAAAQLSNHNFFRTRR